MTIGASEAADFTFFLTDTGQLVDSKRHFSLSLRDFESINPNTKTCPIFRSNMDAELTRKIYSRIPVLIREATGNAPEENPWGIKFLRMLDMSNDSNLFENAAGEGLLPLYEAKMIHQFDHRWASYAHNGGEPECRDVPEELKNNPDLTVTPRYWVSEKAVLKRLAHIVGLDPDIDDIETLRALCPRWLMGWRDICRATDERTVIASVLPRAGVGHTMPLLFMGDITPEKQALFLANLNTLSFDFFARLKVGGTHLTYTYLRQFPVLPPAVYAQSDIDFIVPHVLELTYTSHDTKSWPENICPSYTGNPFPFDPERRAVLRAELDAYYAKLYGLTRDELRYILDPQEVMGPDYPSETFRVLKDNEIKRYGEYRTRRLVLEAWDKLGY